MYSIPRLHPHDGGVVHRAGLDLERGDVVLRAKPVGGQGIQEPRPAVEDADVGSVELVGRAEQKVDVEGRHVQGEMGGVVDGIHQEPGPDGLGKASRFRDVVDRAEGIGGKADGDKAGLRGDLGGHVAIVQPAGGKQLHFLHDDAPLGKVQPGAAVGLVVELRDDDLVSRGHFAYQGVAQGEVQGRHVVAEGDAAPVRGSQEGRDGFAGFLYGRVGFVRRDEHAVGVGVAGLVVPGNGIDHLLRDLRSAGTVKVGQPVPVMGPGQGRKIFPATRARLFVENHSLHLLWGACFPEKSK